LSMPSLANFSALLAAIHEAALAPESWNDVMVGLTSALGANYGAIIAGRTGEMPATMVATNADPIFAGSYDAYYREIDPVVPRVQAMSAGTVVTHGELMPAGAMLRTEFYNDWARPQGVHGCMIAKFMPSGSTGVVCLSMPSGAADFGSDEVDFVGALTPHLRIAVRTQHLVSGLELQRDAALEVLGRIGHASLFVDASGKVVYANKLAEELLRQGDGLSFRDGALGCASNSSTASLRRLMFLATRSPTPRGGSLRLERPSGRAPLVVTISPVSGRNLERMSLSDPRALVIASMPEHVSGEKARALQDLFGMTPAEVTVTIAIANGGGVKRCAELLGVAVSTVRTHLHRAFEKTGTSRQAELAFLVSQLTL
jgi:DNA-binding CsgD family transcriptional regulator